MDVDIFVGEGVEYLCVGSFLVYLYQIKSLIFTLFASTAKEDLHRPHHAGVHLSEAPERWERGKF